MPGKIRILCRTARATERADALFAEIDGRSSRLTLHVGQLTTRIAKAIDPLTTDLLELAGYVYLVDAAISRGGPTARKMGKDWRRTLHLVVPVRRPEIWSRPELVSTLQAALDFVSEDSWQFTFLPADAPPQADGYLKLVETKETAPTSVMMFSGGLDSFAGALDEILARGSRVALVTHGSGTKLAPIQHKLVAYLQSQTSDRTVAHLPVRAQIAEGQTRETTHRARSFLFAALGMATARSFGLDRVHFYENGIVSMNLPLGNHVVGARATRSTHPQTLAHFSQFFTMLFDRQITVDNPFFWKTKAEVIDVLRQHDAQDVIKDTFSCAHVREITRQHTHCGRCSQCVDRRLSMLAAGLSDEDPAVDYRIDLLRDPLTETLDRELALSYIRAARRYRKMDERDFVAAFPETLRALDALGQDRREGLRRIVALHRRHGEGIAGTVDSLLAGRLQRGDGQDEDPSSLLSLIGQEAFHPPQPWLAPVSEAASPSRSEVLTLRIDAAGSKPVEIAGLGTFSGAHAETLTTLADNFLKARGKGLAPEDHTFEKAGSLARIWRLEGDMAVRQRIAALRSLITRRARAAGRQGPDRNSVVENVPWRGYRLNPTSMDVTRYHE